MLSPKAPKHINLVGPTGAGKSSALYTATVALRRWNPQLRVFYIAHCHDWTLNRSAESRLAFFLCELVRAFARDREVVEVLLQLVKKHAPAGLIKDQVVFKRFVLGVGNYFEQNHLKLLVVADGAEFIDKMEEEFPFSCLEYVGKSARSARIVRAGSAMQAYKSRHMHEASQWQTWSVEGAFEAEALSDLCAQRQLPFDPAKHPSSFNQVCEINGGNLLEIDRFAEACRTLGAAHWQLQTEDLGGEGDQALGGTALDCPPPNWDVLHQVIGVYSEKVGKHFNTLVGRFEKEVKKGWSEVDEKLFVSVLMHMNLGVPLSVTHDGCENYLNQQLQYVTTNAEGEHFIRPVSPLYGRLLEQRYTDQLEKYMDLHIQQVFVKSPKKYSMAVKGYAVQDYFLRQIVKHERLVLRPKLIRKKGPGEQELVDAKPWVASSLRFEEVYGHGVPTKDHNGWQADVTVWGLISSNYPSIDLAIWFRSLLLLVVLQIWVQSPEKHRRSTFDDWSDRGRPRELWQVAAAHALKKRVEDIEVQFGYVAAREPLLKGDKKFEGKYFVKFQELDHGIWPHAKDLRLDYTPT